MLHFAFAAWAALSLVLHQGAASLDWRFGAVGTEAGIEIRVTQPRAMDCGSAPDLLASEFRDLNLVLYRGLDPHFAEGPKSLLSYITIRATEGRSLPTDRPLKVFLDAAPKLRPGVTYYYKLERQFGSMEGEPIEPEGLGVMARPDALAAAATMPFPPIDVVFIGDSITYGANLHPGDPTPCDVCAHSMELGPKPRDVFFSNEGHSGHTTKDFLPGGEDFFHAESAATKLDKDHPGELVFSVMLGTNDSADAGPSGSPIDAPHLEANLKIIVDKLLRDFPQCKVVLNRATWYSPNTHNGATYEESGLARLTSYFPVIHSLPRQFPAHRVFEGDTRAYDYFAATYEFTLNAEPGRNGTFYLHPNRAGAQALGQLWAAAILRVIG